MSALSLFLPVRILCTFNYHGSLVAPNPTVTGRVLNKAGDHVVHVAFGLSPLHDCLYVFDIEAKRGWHRAGYAMAAINALWQRFRVPIRAVHVTMTGEPFWDPSRFRRRRIALLPDLSSSEMMTEKERWPDLIPWSDELSEHIRQRLFDQWLPYHEAVSVGLDFPGRKMSESDNIIAWPELQAPG